MDIFSDGARRRVGVVLHEHKTFDAREATADDIITWVFEQDSYAPMAKIKGDKKYSIVTDHLGTPIRAYTDSGDKMWERELDSFGNVRMGIGDEAFCNYLYQGQSYDRETGLAYNRFRYYDPEQGNYISQDPIGLAGGNPTLYGYVGDPTGWLDVFGLFGDEFDVDLHKDLLGAKSNSNLRSHHVGQKAIMNHLVVNYDEMKAPAILVDKMGHNNNKPGFEPGIVSRSKINPKTGKPFANARELLARDIRELRRVYPDIPNSKLKELIDLNKKMYPEMQKPIKTGYH